MLSEGSAAPAVSVLVCTRDRREMLDALLPDLLAQRYDGEVEIVVVEETDRPKAPHGVRYVPIPVRDRGIAYARNRAVACAAHDLLVFVDDDCRVGPEWLERLVAPFADPSVLGVQGGVTVPGGSNAIGWAETVLGFPGGGYARIVEAADAWRGTREVSTLNAAYRRRAVVEAGGFPEAARLGGEDYLLAKRVAACGRLLFVPEAVVRHEPRGRLGAIWRWFLRRGRAEAALFRSGLAPGGYGRYLLRASLALKLLPAVILLPLFWWASLLIVAALLVAPVWRTRRLLGRREIPRAAWAVLPVVKVVMDLGADVGRARALFGRRV